MKTEALDTQVKSGKKYAILPIRGAPHPGLDGYSRV
jgi:hypothetical protein